MSGNAVACRRHEVSRADLNGLATLFSSHPLFGQPMSFLNEDNPFLRPLRRQDAATIDLTVKLAPSQIATNAALFGQRLLTTIYEAELLFLPETMDRPRREAFAAFYDDDLKCLGERLRPGLEHQLFGFLDDEIETSGHWTMPSFRAYAEHALAQANTGESAVVRAILEARNPATAADEFLVQLSSDFITEASAMARNVLGNYGPAQSGLFTILIDEYGYGVPASKHSTIFETTLKSRGLDHRPHAYWQFFLPSSLALVNYFHLVSRNHKHFGRYVGALLYTEATLAEANRQQSEMLRRIFGAEVDTRYFDEHHEIDAHHGRMAMERVIVPLVERVGDWILADVVRGFEEFKLLQTLADKDLMDQLAFGDRLFKAPMAGDFCSSHPDMWSGPDVLTFTEPKGEVSVLHIHDQAELFQVTEGAVEFTVGPLHSIELAAGQSIVIPGGRLHGTRVLSDTCSYRIRKAAGLGLAA
ncbi:iron-containing redox enzyme family protein [Azospirillum brasilense]|uniref:iron-containing redox enzyme family protein n=1 Tax=Azospirillum brasilense TaxID=192 RepID=UPI000E0A641C|nr:iron-containing redox enzyme family protein [Azospirillum brasilense]